MIRANVIWSATRFGSWPVWATILLAAAQMVQAQSILGTNLIVNGDAEMGKAGTDLKTPVATIPGWTTQSGKPTVLPYNATGYVQLTDPTPPHPGFQYFAAAFPSLPAVISQTIDISPAASLINAGNAEFIGSAYMGSIGGLSMGTQMAIAFQNANGQTFSTVIVGSFMFPLATSGTSGMFFQQQIGLVPVGTVRVTISLTLQDGNLDTGVADSLSFMLTQVGNKPSLGTNLVVNGGAEAGPNAALPAHALYVPGWSTTKNEASVAPYGGAAWVSPTDPGPPDRGTSVFCGWLDSTDLFQDIDVSAAASLIDSAQVTYVVSGWLGGSNSVIAATLTYEFFDWSGKQLAPTAGLTPGSFNGFRLIETEYSGTLPAGTRRVRIILNFRSSDSLADNIAFVLSVPNGPPVITPGGVVSASAFGGFTSIGQGSWIEIYGINLALDTRGWTGADFNNGVAPTSLDGVKVSVGGVPAFIDFISPTQIDALVPTNAPTGVQELTVTTATGTSDGFGIIVNQTEPGLLAPSSFLIGDKQYLAALFTDGSFAIPQNAISGVPSRPAKPGDTLIVYGVGFGAVSGGFAAGTLVNQQNSLTTPVQFLFGTTLATLSYYGLAPSYTGLYQFNVVVPNVPNNNAMPISFTLGGVKGSQTLYIAVQN